LNSTHHVTGFTTQNKASLNNNIHHIEFRSLNSVLCVFFNLLLWSGICQFCVRQLHLIVRFVGEELYLI